VPLPGQRRGQQQGRALLLLAGYYAPRSRLISPCPPPRRGAHAGLPGLAATCAMR